MTETNNIDKLKFLIEAYQKDDKWLKEVAKLTGLNEKNLNTKKDLKAFWKKNWGKLTIKNLTNNDEISWERNDGGPKVVSRVEHKDLNLSLLKTILRGMLTEELKNNKMLSFVSIGYPKEWDRCKIYLNDREISNVRWACSILGMCEVLAFDNKGKPKLDKKEEIATEQLHGKVVIVVGDKRLSFF